MSFPLGSSRSEGAYRGSRDYVPSWERFSAAFSFFNHQSCFLPTLSMELVPNCILKTQRDLSSVSKRVNALIPAVPAGPRLASSRPGMVQESTVNPWDPHEMPEMAGIPGM